MTDIAIKKRAASENWRPLRELIATQCRVLIAIMLRDIATRFLGSRYGFLISIGWPLTHVLFLLALYQGLGRLAPYGDSAAVWFATGVVPMIAFGYMARFTMIGIVLNKPMLIFPVVKVTDILFARAIVELLSAGLVILILSLIFLGFGINFMPLNPAQACFAIGASMLLGLGVGVINAIIAAAFPFWLTGYQLIYVFMWATSGVLFVAHALPEKLRYPLSFSPIVHGVEWMRSAYYEGYGDGYLDKGYIVGWGLGCLCLGLLLERLVRGRLMR